MDPASAIIGIVSFGFTVIGKINEIRKAIKDAPDQVQELQDSSITVSLLLSRIQVAGSCALSRSSQIDTYFGSLRKRAENCLKKVDETIEKVVAQKPPSSGGTDRHRIRLNTRRWFMEKGTLADLTGKLAEVRKVLCEMLEFLQVNYLEHIVDRIDGIEQVVGTMTLTQTRHTNCLEHIADQLGSVVNIFMTSTMQGYSFHPPTATVGMIDDTQHNLNLSVDSPKCGLNASVDLHSMSTAASASPVKPRVRGPLRCPPKCECRCHYPLVTELIPHWLASYIGQVSISKRLLQPTFSSWSLCNVPTCRGDFQRAATVQWILPPGFLHGVLQSRKDRRIHFAIGAPRIVSCDSPILHAVSHGDLQTVRNLFATGQASIWDYTVDGMPVFWEACGWWQDNPSEESLKIIGLFVEAGAAALLFEETQLTYSAHDELAVGLFKYVLAKSKRERMSGSLATIMRTNEAAIYVFRSLFNMDPMDALEDYLDRKRAQDIDVAGFLESLENIGCNSVGHLSVLEVTGYTPLQYAIIFSPENVKSLLEVTKEEDHAAEHTLAYAMLNKRSELIKPLLDAGAEVNLTDWRGYTVLHWACSRCYYKSFLELLQWAEDDIDWDACTVDGQNALELFDLSVLAGWAACLERSQIDQFRAELVAHMDTVEEESDGEIDMPGAFPDAL